MGWHSVGQRLPSQSASHKKSRIKCSSNTFLVSILTPFSIGAGVRWLSEKVKWHTSKNVGAVMSGNPGCLGWQPTGKDNPYPTHVMAMQSSAWGILFVTPVIDPDGLKRVLHRTNATIDICLANNDSQQIADSTHTIHVLCSELNSK